jgi:hypothetical protein
MNTYTTVSNQEYYEVLFEDAQTGETSWTVNRNARAGDRILLYICAPVSAIVATAVVVTEPEKDEDPNSVWFDHWFADMEELRMLPEPITRQMLLEKFPDWGYWTQPRNSVRVPEEYLIALGGLLERHSYT